MLKTPYYLIHESSLLKNLKRIQKVRRLSGAKVLLALKCFATWSVFDLMKQYMDGTTSSSPYEVRLGREKFGGETHSFSVGYTKKDVLDIKDISDKIIFNSTSQLRAFQPLLENKNLGLRVNPGISYSHFDLANPNRQYSRLGVSNFEEISYSAPLIKGLMFHYNCENRDFKALKKSISFIQDKYDPILRSMEWVSLGGGISFTSEGYPIDEFSALLKDLSKKYKIQIYLEPGEAAVQNSTELITSVVDIVNRDDQNIAIIDSSVEAHTLDLLTYKTPASIDTKGSHKYIIAGRSCLAGDIFGTFNFPKKLKVGNKIKIQNAASYTMVKMNWFNGLKMPAIVIKRLDGKLDTIKEHTYKDFKNNIS